MPGFYKGALPQSRVETADPTTLHLAGEFAEGNLGSALEPDGAVTVRAVGQEYSFTPQCMVVPTDALVTFRATSADVVHGFLIEGTNINTMLVPGYISQLSARFTTSGRTSDALPGILRGWSSGHVGEGQGRRQSDVHGHGGEGEEAELC